MVWCVGWGMWFSGFWSQGGLGWVYGGLMLMLVVRDVTDLDGGGDTRVDLRVYRLLRVGC